VQLAQAGVENAREEEHVRWVLALEALVDSESGS
jgi:hypothetical protein